MRLFKLILAAVTAAAWAAPARASEPGGTPDALFFSEAALAGAVGIAFFVGGYAVGGDPKINSGTTREKASYAIYGAAPAASALAVYAVGETAGFRAANRGPCLFATVGASVAVTGGAATLGYFLTKEDKTAGALTAAFYTLVPVAFLNALVYNAVKEPFFADIPGFSKVEVRPTVGVTSLADPVIVSGVAISF